MRVLTVDKTRLQRLIEQTTARHYKASLRGLKGRNWRDVAGPGHTWASRLGFKVIARMRELLSDGELGQQLFASMVPNLEDSLEQYKLSTEASPHLLAAYGVGSDSKLFPGTVELAKALGIKHPQVHGDGAVELWRASTDLVLVRRPPGEPHDALALAFKAADWQPTRRAWDLLRLEREFWVRRNVLWLLITPALYDERVVLTLRRTGCWALDAEVPDEVRRWAAATARECPFDGLTRVLERVAVHTGSMESAQRAIWQAACGFDIGCLRAAQ
jgi:TnsA endonuclease N terminal